MKYSIKSSVTPWIAEQSIDGFFQVVSSDGIILAQKCVKEEAQLFAEAPELLEACKMMADWIDRLPLSVRKKHLPQLFDPEGVGLLWVLDVIENAEGTTP